MAILATALAAAMLKVGDKVLVEPLLKPAIGLVGNKVDKDVLALKKAEHIQEALAVVKAELSYDDNYPLARAAGKLQSPQLTNVCETVIAVALVMTSEQDDAKIPHVLLKQLDLGNSDRAEFAKFLWAFRTALIGGDLKDADFVTLADRAEEQDARNKLLEFVDEMGKLIVRTATGPALRTLATIVPPEKRVLERIYLEQILTGALRHVPLNWRHKDNALRMEMKNIYINLYTSDRDQSKEPARSLFGRRKPDPETEMAREQLPPWSALKSLLTHKHLVLLGHPGSGKTTFADYLTLCLAGARYEQDPQDHNPLIPPAGEWLFNLYLKDARWDKDIPLPFRFRLRELSADQESMPLGVDGTYKHILDFIDKQLEVGKFGPDFIDHAFACINKGDALLIFDGLDEVGDPKRRTQVAQAIANFAEQRCARATILITCRVRQYSVDNEGKPSEPWALPRFHHTVLQDFDDAQITTFVRGWYKELERTDSTFQEDADEMADSLLQEILHQESFHGIAGRPILLTQQAIVHQVDGHLPGTRGQLYARCADLLLWEWERQRARGDADKLLIEDYIRDVLDLPKLSKEDLQYALDHAVFDAHKNQGDADDGPVNIPEFALVRYISEVIGFSYPDLDEILAEAKAKFFLRDYLSKRNGLLVPAGEDSFQTPHRSFQEFMAARWLVEDDDFDTTVVGLVEDNFTLWREVFLLSLGLTTTGNKVRALRELCESSQESTSNAWERSILAGQAMAELGLSEIRRDRRRGENVIAQLQSRLQHIMQDTDAHGKPYSPSVIPVPTRYQAGEMLDKLEWLPDDLDSWVEFKHDRQKLYIAKYPVTNHQFAKFIDAGGYGNPAWWGGEASEAWQWRKSTQDSYGRKGPFNEPWFWQHVRFGKNRRGYPLVGVSWYEANAYCAWLTAKLRENTAKEPASIWIGGIKQEMKLSWEQLQVRLSTEPEWVQAAGGEQNDRYPWGEWDASKANTSESDLGGTSPVGMYLQGCSPHGVWDMAGNVWEWMGNSYSKTSQALRGGSWSIIRQYSRVAYRYRRFRNYSGDYIGFRVLVSPNSSES